VAAALAILAALVLSAWPGWSADKAAGRLLLRDALTVPGQPARIEARLVREGMLGQAGLGGEPLELLVGGRSAATAMTGGDGRAFFEFTPVMRGTQPITVRLASTRRVASGEATAFLASWERRRPILLVEIEALAEAPAAPALPIPPLPLLPGDEQPKPLPKAADELTKLTAYFYNVLYLSRTKGPGAVVEASVRDWLRGQRFPPGLTRALEPGRKALEALLDEMRREGWDNLKTGVGRTREFAEVLAERRLKVVILPASGEEGRLPKKVMTADNWEEVRKKIQR
jgi:hypothetical protein